MEILSFFLFIIQFGGAVGLHVDDFIPFGEDSGDTIFFSSDDNTTSIAMPLRFPFFNRYYSTIHINNNGLLSFESAVSDYTPEDFPVEPEDGVTAAFIAPFWADVDTRGGTGKVYFRSTDEQTVLDMIKRIIDKVPSPKGSCPLASHITLKWALIATWFDVGYYELNYDKLNTFQVVVTTDGLFSFAIFNYAKIEWVTGDASQGSDGFGGTPAMVGVNVGDGVRAIKYNYSLTDEVVQVINATNVGVPGQLVYRIDDNMFNSGSGDKCDTGTLCLSPSRGTLHSGGLLSVTGPPQVHLTHNRDKIKIVFEGQNEVLYTKCSYETEEGVVNCPAPLFSLNAAGIKNVTLLIDNCTTGYTGQYTVGPDFLFDSSSISKGHPETFLTLRDNRFTAPLNLTSDSSNNLNRTTYLCYQLYVIPHAAVNLFSSSSMTINAQYVFNVGHYFISTIGIVVGGTNVECTTITANTSQCEIEVNGKRILSASYQLGQYNIQVTATKGVSSNGTLTITSSVNDRIIVRVACGRDQKRSSNANTLSLSLPISLLHLNFHGLLGQFWNVPATVTHPDCEDFALFSHLPLYKVVLPTNVTENDGSSKGNSNRTIPVILYSKSWDTAGSSPCLYTSYEGPSVIAGSASDYIVGNLSSTQYQYSRFTIRCA